MEMTEEEIRAWKKRLQEEGERPRPFAWGRQPRTFAGHTGAVTALAITADGRVHHEGPDALLLATDGGVEFDHDNRAPSELHSHPSAQPSPGAHRTALPTLRSTNASMSRQASSASIL